MFILEPILQFIHFIHAVCHFVLTTSCYIGQGFLLLFGQFYNIMCSIVAALEITGRDLLRFLHNLDATFSAIGDSTNSSLLDAHDGIGQFVVQVLNFLADALLNTRLFTTKLGRSVAELIWVLWSACCLIGDCVWWLLTIVPCMLASLLVWLGSNANASFIFLVQLLKSMLHAILGDMLRFSTGCLILYALYKSRHTVLRFLRRIKINRRRTHRIPVSEVLDENPGEDGLIAESMRCVICRDKRKNIVLLPCRHLCLCATCRTYIQTDRGAHCPLCRRRISGFIPVYL